uniref:SLH domain-containing protein n=1 Tax=uncultured Bacillota bacterium TaxID=344338 RepID=A0A650EQM1_9FIRM|nr:hypothetical protein Firmicute1046_3300 [uncultured Firmicutes bacterium]
MTKLRKSICILLAAVLFAASCGLGVIASAGSDVSDSEVGLLVGLGIMEGSGTGSLNLEKEVTRGEFAAMIFRMMDLDAVSFEPMFRDVSRSNWAFDYVQTVAAQGYLRGDADGNFRPDDTIVLEEAAKILVAMLGYTYPAEEEGGYPAGYISVGTRIGVFSGVNLAYGKALTRGEVARLLYNCLDIKLMQQSNFGDKLSYHISADSTMLTDYLHVTDIRGTVRANHWVNLSGEYEIAQGQVVIDDVLYYTGKTDIADRIGTTVHAYVKLDESDPIQTVLYYEPAANQKNIVVKAEDIHSTTSESEFVYMDGNKNRKVSIPSDVTLIWNGKARFSFNGETLRPKTGDVTLIMDGGTLNMICVNSYESKVVQAVSEGTKTVYYKNNAAPTVLEDTEIQYTILKKDKKVDIDELAENDIVSIAESEDGMLVKMIVSNETLTGTVTAVTKDKYAVDSMAYPVSAYYAGKELDLGKEGTFYLDVFGYIVFAEYDSVSRDYAFLLARGLEDGLSAKLKMKLLTMAGQIEEKTVEEKVKFNDVKTDVAVVFEQLTARQLIKVQVSSAGEVLGIWTAADNTGASAAEYDTEEFSKDVEGKELRYKDKLFSDGDNLYCADDNTPVMVVALDSNDQINERECKVSTVPGTFAADTKYSDMIFYDLDADTRVPKIMVRLRQTGASSVNADNGVCVIEETYMTTDEDGTPIRGLRYYRDGQIYESPVENEVISTRQNNGSDSRNVPDVFQNVAFDDLQKGDVIQISTNIDGHISVFRPVFVQKYAPAEHTQLVSGGGSGYTEFPTFETYYATISKRSTQIMTLKMGAKESSVVCTRPKVYRVNSARDRLEVLSINDLTQYLNHGNVFAHVSRKACQTVVIYD